MPRRSSRSCGGGSTTRSWLHQKPQAGCPLDPDRAHSRAPTSMLILFIAAALAYGAATFAYGSRTEADPPGGPGSEPSTRWARPLLAIAAVLHMLAIGAQCVQ